MSAHETLQDRIASGRFTLLCTEEWQYKEVTKKQFACPSVWCSTCLRACEIHGVSLPTAAADETIDPGSVRILLECLCTVSIDKHVSVQLLRYCFECDNQPFIAEELVACGVTWPFANGSTVGRGCWTDLHLVARWASVELLKACLERHQNDPGFDINALLHSHNMNALELVLNSDLYHHAHSTRRMKAAALLIAHGARLDTSCVCRLLGGRFRTVADFRTFVSAAGLSFRCGNNTSEQSCCRSADVHCSLVVELDRARKNDMLDYYFALREAGYLFQWDAWRRFSTHMPSTVFRDLLIDLAAYQFQCQFHSDVLVCDSDLFFYFKASSVKNCSESEMARAARGQALVEQRKQTLYRQQTLETCCALRFLPALILLEVCENLADIAPHMHIGDKYGFVTLVKHFFRQSE